MIFNYDVSDLQSAITSLDNGKVARSPVYITSLTELDNYVTSEFFIPSADIAIGNTGVTIPAYSRCIFVNSASTDGALIVLTYSGSIISAFRNNGTWINARINTPDSPALTGTPTAPTAASGTNTTQIATTAFTANAVASEATARQNADTTLQTTLQTNLQAYTDNAVANVNGTIAVSTEAQLIGKSKFFNATANIPLGSTGVTIEQYARGVVISPDDNTGSIVAIGYSGKIYTAFFESGIIRTARTFLEYSDQASGSGSFTPSMINCTPNYTLQSGYYRKISRDMLYIRVILRGTISAVGNPAYAQINISNLSALSGFDGDTAVTSIREAYGCCQSVPYNVIASGSGTSMVLSLQTQTGAGTTSNTWKTTSSTFYIDLDVLLIRQT